MRSSASNFALGLVLSAACAAAGDPTPTPAPASQAADTSDTITAPKPAGEYIPAPPSDSDGQARSVSPGIAAALAAGLPKYSPPTPSPTPTPDVDMRDLDKPKNEIHRLPQFVVREKRPPIFRAKDLYTPLGVVDLEFRSHPGLYFGNFLGLNEGAAQQMYLDDERKANIDDLNDEAHAMSLGGDKAESSFILKQSDATYMRGGDWDWSGSGPVGIK